MARPARRYGRRCVLADHKFAGAVFVGEAAPNPPVFLDRPAADWLERLGDKVWRTEVFSQPCLQSCPKGVVQHESSLSSIRCGPHSGIAADAALQSPMRKNAGLALNALHSWRSIMHSKYEF